MGKKIYWLLGIAAIALLLWFGMRGDGGDQPGKQVSEESGAQHAQMQHPSPEHASGYLQEQDAAMAEMMRAMESVAPTGNAALDFLAGMLPHHVAAIAMAESYLNHGGANETLRQVAQDVIVAQKREIEQMQAMAQALREKGEQDAAKEAAYLEAYKAMLAQHHASHGISGTMDEAFAEGMILHHQMAVDMSKSILNYAQEEDVRALAQEIVSAQEREIAQMQSVLNAPKAS